MKASYITSLLGYNANSSEIVSLIQNLGFDHVPLPKRGENCSYIDASSNRGIELCFSYVDDYFEANKLRYTGDELVLVSIFFFSSTLPDKASYDDTLPYGLIMNMPREKIVSILGESSWHRESGGLVKVDRWNMPDHLLFANYDFEKKLNMLTIQTFP